MGRLIRGQAIGVTGLLLVVAVATAACGDAVPAAFQCDPTSEDELGPLYRPGAPQRNRVGSGYLLFGTVKSAGDCRPVAGATLEVWLAGPQGTYGDAWRATLQSTGNGRYYFASHPPPAYGAGRAHIHVRVSAPGFKTLVTQHYPLSGAGESQFDLVLRPSSSP